jgi:hypothetical protein
MASVSKESSTPTRKVLPPDRYKLRVALCVTIQRVACTFMTQRDNTLGHSIEAGIYVSKGATARCEGGTLRGNGLAGGYVDESAHLTLVEQTIESNREAGVLVMSGGHGRVLKSCLRWNGLANLSVLHLGARCDVVSHPALALCTEVECERRVILFL